MARGPTRARPQAVAFAAKGHDHRRCVDRALAAAQALCAAKGSRLTTLRRQVLELVWHSHQPVGAYDVLDDLARRRGRVAPPTVYRALEFLLAHGLVHRIESLNAYVGCADPGQRHQTQFLICTACGTAAELDDPGINIALAQAAAALGFAGTRAIVEMAGQCPDCRADLAGGAAGDTTAGAA